MPYREVDTGFWTDPFIVKLPFEAKGLYLYLWTNTHCNQAGLYEIALETIASETKLGEDLLPKLLDILKPKVLWYEENNLIWVKNFIKRQSKSPKFLAAVAKSLTTIHHNGAIEELLTYNRERYNISIPYQYYMDRVSVVYGYNSATATVSVSGKDRGVKGGKELAAASRLYEENIGMLTPAIAEGLKDVVCQYPAGWFEEALKEAVKSEHRNLKYILAILERWRVEGFKASRKGAKGQQQLSTTKELKEGWKQK